MEHNYLFVVTYDHRIDKMEIVANEKMSDFEIIRLLEDTTGDNHTLDITSLKKIEVEYDNGDTTESHSITYVPRLIRIVKKMIKDNEPRTIKGVHTTVETAQMILKMYNEAQNKHLKMLVAIVPLDFLDLALRAMK